MEDDRTPASRRMLGRAEQVLDTHTRRRARRPSSRSPRCGRWATSTPGEPARRAEPRPARATATAAPSRDRSAPDRHDWRRWRGRDASHSSTVPRQRLGAPVWPWLTDGVVEERRPAGGARARPRSSRARRALLRCTRPAARAWSSAPRRAGRTDSPSRIAPSRRSTRSTRSSRSASHSVLTVSLDLVGQLPRHLVGVECGCQPDPRPVAPRRRGRRRRRTPRAPAGRAPASHAAVPERSWNWPGRRRAASRSGYACSERGAGAVGIDRARIEGDTESAREVGGAVLVRGRRRPGRRVRGCRVRRSRASRTARSLGSSSARAAQDVALVEQGGDRGSRARSARRRASLRGGDGPAASASAGRGR